MSDKIWLDEDGNPSGPPVGYDHDQAEYERHRDRLDDERAARGDED